MAQLNTTAASFSGGVTASNGTGEDYKFTFGGTWATNDIWSVILTDKNTGVQTLVGAGNVSGQAANFCFTYNQKVYVTYGANVGFSAVGLPTQFKSPNTSGNGFVAMSNTYGTPEDLVAIAPYQGRLVFFSRRTAQIWQVDADPGQWQQIQVMNNIGTFASNSVQPVGDLDVMFLSDTGIRSLKVRDSSLNAFVNDIGSPIDDLVTAFNPATSTAADACAVVDPTSGRYWCYISGTIFVLSYFPGSKITGWSIYQATYQNAQGNQEFFAVQKFFIFQGQVCALVEFNDATTAIMSFGGTDGVTYDNCAMSFTCPFLDSKRPGDWKVSKGFDAILTGDWAFSGSLDYISGTYTEIVASVTESTTLSGTLGFPGHGTHASLKGLTTSSSRATVSSLMWHFEPSNETA